MAFAYVLDASVGIKLFVEEDDSWANSGDTIQVFASQVNLPRRTSIVSPDMLRKSYKSNANVLSNVRTSTLLTGAMAGNGHSVAGAEVSAPFVYALRLDTGDASGILVPAELPNSEAVSRGHYPGVTVMTISPNGRTLLVGYSSNVVAKWNAETFVQSGYLEIKHKNGTHLHSSVLLLSASPSGRRLAIADSLGIYLADMDNMEILKVIDVGGWADTLLCLDDETVLVLGAGEARLWSNGEPPSSERWEIPLTRVSCVALERNRHWVAAGHPEEDKVVILDPAGKQVIQTIALQRGGSTALAFSKDGSNLAIAEAGGTISTLQLK